MKAKQRFKIALIVTFFGVVCFVLPKAFLIFDFWNLYPRLSQLLLYSVASILFIYFSNKSWNEFGVRITNFNWKNILSFVIGIQAIPFITFLLLYFSRNLLLSNWMRMSLGEITIIYLVFAPIIEELFFRGVIQSTLSTLIDVRLKIGDVYMSLPVLLTAIMFAMIHSTYSALALVFIVLLGLLCGYMREKYKSLLPAIFAHFFFNYFAVFLPRVIQLTM